MRVLLLLAGGAAASSAAGGGDLLACSCCWWSLLLAGGAFATAAAGCRCSSPLLAAATDGDGAFGGQFFGVPRDGFGFQYGFPLLGFPARFLARSVFPGVPVANAAAVCGTGDGVLDTAG